MARFVPLALVAVLAAACGASHRSATSSETTAPSGPSSTLAAGATTTLTTLENAGSTGGAAQTPVNPASTTTSQAPVANPAATSPNPGGNAANRPNPSTATAAPKPAIPGTYQERQTGSFTALGKTTAVPPQGTLVVDAGQSNGTQVWHRYVQPGQAPNDTTLQFASKGTFLLSTTEQSPRGNVTCTFNPAVPAPPWPPAVGDTFSSSGNCGQFTVSLTGRITGQRAVALGGASYDTWVVDTSLSFHGQVTGSGTQEDWYSPVLRVPLHETSDIHGSYGPFSFSSQLTSDVTSIP